MKRSSSTARRLGSAAIVFGTASILFAAGCGSAASVNTGSPSTVDGKVASSVMPQDPPAPQSVSEAEAQLVLAERNVFGAFGRDKQDGQFAQPPGQPVAQGAVTAESSPPPAPRGEDRAAKDGDRVTATGGAAASPQFDSASSSPCETACRALASMNRAATHLCSLAGEESEYCSNARERLRAATERVRQSCSECAG